ncbi:hypothetical protein [Streptomyces asiaticus]|uniref:hypothetical protein n=1 Tax=Streptomyces asiaticus TaxID=114695 RepID=UPI001BA7BA23|nr:hypothetical protein [Streptomyces asiaticus]
MSTRHVVEHVLKDYGYSPAVATRIVTNLLNEHAHALAEEIRNIGPESGLSEDEAVGLWYAADFIDSEVTS